MAAGGWATVGDGGWKEKIVDWSMQREERCSTGEKSGVDCNEQQKISGVVVLGGRRWPDDWL
jgi:hypothetical protein